LGATRLFVLSVAFAIELRGESVHSKDTVDYAGLLLNALAGAPSCQCVEMSYRRLRRLEHGDIFLMLGAFVIPGIKPVDSANSFSKSPRAKIGRSFSEQTTTKKVALKSNQLSVAVPPLFEAPRAAPL